VRETADAIVIGAGIIGASIAWRLSQRGLRVTLVDAGRAGGEASWAGAGMLAPGGEVTEATDWSRFALESHALYPGFVDELRSETGCPIDYQRQGAIEFAATAADWLELKSRAAWQRELGILSEPAAREGAAGALFYPGDGAVDPRDVVAALLAACKSTQVRLQEGRPVTGIRAHPRSVEVETKTGRLTAALAVLAAGAWSGAIPFALGPRPAHLPGSFPVRGHLIGYRLHPGACPTIVRSGDTYILQRSNGLLIAGASTENAGFDRRIDPDIVSAIARRAEALLPSLRQAGTPEAWLGFRPRANAHQPHIGRFADSNLWLAYGHYRNGILLAPATARRISTGIMSTWGTDLPSPAGNR
jgi:glycine oxidase